MWFLQSKAENNIIQGKIKPQTSDIALARSSGTKIAPFFFFFFFFFFFLTLTHTQVIFSRFLLGATASSN